MFDDKPVAPQGAAPQNLPMGEPEDLFGQTDLPVPSPSPSASGEPPSALDAGILKPKEQPLPPPLPFQNPTPVAPAEESQIPGVNPMANPNPTPATNMDSMYQMNSLKEPSMSRGILVVIIVVVAVFLIGGAGWWVYRYINVPEQAPTPSLDDTEEDAGVVSPESSDEETSAPSEDSSGTLDGEENTVVESDATSTQPVDETLLFGDATDTDTDGLDDRREENLGTDPEKVDTDGDELTDGDEVIIWGTNPLNPDTDGDTFLDGKEIKAGFSPKGPGKLFEVKSTSSSTTSS